MKLASSLTIKYQRSQTGQLNCFKQLIPTKSWFLQTALYTDKLVWVHKQLDGIVLQHPDICPQIGLRMQKHLRKYLYLLIIALGLQEVMPNRISVYWLFPLLILLYHTEEIKGNKFL